MAVMQAGLAKRRFTFRDVFTFLVALIWMGKLDSIPQSAMDLPAVDFLAQVE